MEEITKSISKELLKAELTEDKRSRITNKSNNQIYIATHQNAPNVMGEVGRLRKITLRTVGGSTGLSTDINEYGMMKYPYEQLTIWSSEAEEIPGGYRYLLGTDVRFDEKGALILTTSHVFHFSDAFIKEYPPQAIELGRSLVTLEYQSTRTGNKGLFVLDSPWDGLGVSTVAVPNVRYFFGKVAMYPNHHHRGHDMILHFLKKHFYDKEKLVTPVEPLKSETSEDELSALFCKHFFKEDYKTLSCEIRKLGYNIPPLVNVYVSLSPIVRMFGIAINYESGDVEGTGILIAVDEILEDKRIRHIQTFIESHPDALRLSSCEGGKAFTPKVVASQVDCSR